MILLVFEGQFLSMHNKKRLFLLICVDEHELCHYLGENVTDITDLYDQGFFSILCFLFFCFIWRSFSFLRVYFHPFAAKVSIGLRTNI